MAKFDKKIYVKIGEQLRKAREDKGMTLEEVAEKMNLTKKTIQRYETGESRISNEKLELLAPILNLNSKKIIDTALHDMVSPESNNIVSFRKLVYDCAKKQQGITTDDLIVKLVPFMSEEDVLSIESDPDNFDQEKVDRYGMALNINLNEKGFEDRENSFYKSNIISVGYRYRINPNDYETINEYACALADHLVKVSKFNDIEDTYQFMMENLLDEVADEDLEDYLGSIMMFAKFKVQELKNKGN